MQHTFPDDEDATPLPALPGSDTGPQFICQQCQREHPRWQRLRFLGQALCLQCAVRLLMTTSRRRPPPHA